jgi:hypothetical protein
MIRFLYKKYKSRQEEKAANEAALASTNEPTAALGLNTEREDSAADAVEPASPNKIIAAPIPKPTKAKELCHHQRQSNEAALESVGEVTKEDALKSPVALKGECLECKAEKRARRIYRWKLVIALFPPQFLASIDTTIVATALTTISSHFGKSRPLLGRAPDPQPLQISSNSSTG